MVKGYEVIHEYVKISSYSLVSIEIKIETTLFFMQNFQENWKLMVKDDGDCAEQYKLVGILTHLGYKGTVFKFY